VKVSVLVSAGSRGACGFGVNSHGTGESCISGRAAFTVILTGKLVNIIHLRLKFTLHCSWVLLYPIETMMAMVVWGTAHLKWRNCNLSCKS